MAALVITILQINLSKIHKNSNAQIQGIQNLSQTNIKNWLGKSPKSGIELTVLGKKLLDKGMHSDAALFFAQANKKDPNFREAAVLLGYTYLKTNSFDLALVAFKTAAQIDPLSPEIQNYLAYTYNKLGDTPNAQICYNKSKELDKLTGS
jgi:cytochrome c-type biogenesis protein CcmH/NrfG